MYAVSNLNYDLVRELINNGANINITDENGWNVFDQLSRKSDVNKDKIKKMEYLLNNPRTSNLHIEDQSNKQFDTTIENQDTDSNLKLEDKNGKELNDMSEKMADRLNKRLEADRETKKAEQKQFDVKTKPKKYDGKYGIKVYEGYCTWKDKNGVTHVETGTKCELK